MSSSTLQCESTSSKPQRVVCSRRNTQREEGARGVQGTGIHKSLLSFVSSVIADCDKLALSYLKPSMGQTLRPAGRGRKWNGFHHRVDFGGSNPHYKPSKSLLLSISLLLFTQIHRFNSLDSSVVTFVVAVCSANSKKCLLPLVRSL